MTKRNFLRFKFVDVIPDALDDDVLYVSVMYAIAVHRCCCGCGNEVVTPFDPTDWKLTFDGKSVSIHPSIGNWSFECQSHYWIIRNRVHWDRRLTKEEIKEGRFRNRLQKAYQYNGYALGHSVENGALKFKLQVRIFLRTIADRMRRIVRR